MKEVVGVSGSIRRVVPGPGFDAFGLFSLQGVSVKRPN